ncbi:hypothetical protein GCM10010331_74010 [Streptomyces xanthochromogenes]|nr:hypothetical protein GCM10010331_74010 [Streptomyces xanthochromogenes]
MYAVKGNTPDAAERFGRRREAGFLAPGSARCREAGPAGSAGARVRRLRAAAHAGRPRRSEREAAPVRPGRREHIMRELRAEAVLGRAGEEGRDALLWHVMSTDDPTTLCGRSLDRHEAAKPPKPDLSDADRYCGACMAAC